MNNSNDTAIVMIRKVFYDHYKRKSESCMFCNFPEAEDACTCPIVRSEENNRGYNWTFWEDEEIEAQDFEIEEQQPFQKCREKLQQIFREEEAENKSDWTCLYHDDDIDDATCTCPSNRSSVPIEQEPVQGSKFAVVCALEAEERPNAKIHAKESSERIEKVCMYHDFDLDDASCSCLSDDDLAPEEQDALQEAKCESSPVDVVQEIYEDSCRFHDDDIDDTFCTCSHKTRSVLEKEDQKEKFSTEPLPQSPQEVVEDSSEEYYTGRGTCMYCDYEIDDAFCTCKAENNLLVFAREAFRPMRLYPKQKQ